ncbi:divergent polysaccharide deacetylase family protein [Marinomonas sp. C2222]|uniref:Divergent polysaccharide deacetylase family protein n=1 Tax=Marinomonas sargassi TaxID=2984494 RepID=A0ABT2YP74_9GAMM|nr:divergent polysaccharide deacetylase family protein [Marinomonas sargassi]MCV2401695.1 divergent polysaccharide deacetylase family protein [Marinomonas sargassi]
MMVKVIQKATRIYTCKRWLVATLLLIVTPLHVTAAEVELVEPEEPSVILAEEEQESLENDALVLGEELDSRPGINESNSSAADVSELSSIELEAAELESTDLESTDLDITDLDSTIPESTELDSIELNSTKAEVLADSVELDFDLADPESHSIADKEVLKAKAERLGPVIVKEAAAQEKQAGPVIFSNPQPWQPSIVPILKSWDSKALELDAPTIATKQSQLPSPISEVDIHPPQPTIAILIDDLGYNRSGMEASLKLPKEVALAILPATPFAKKTATTSNEQQRITLLHAPMENQREMKLGPGGLYQDMTEDELKAVLIENLEGLPGVLGVNNHMGSLLTTKESSMTWVMEILEDRSLFFIDSLTSSDSVAGRIAKEHGLKTVTRDVFLDNIRTEDAIDRQFGRLLKHARRHGTGLAIGHPYPETMSYLKRRLEQIDMDGVKLIPITDILTGS